MMKKPYLNVFIEYIEMDMDVVRTSQGADFNAEDLWQEGGAQ